MSSAQLASEVDEAFLESMNQVRSYCLPLVRAWLTLPASLPSVGLLRLQVSNQAVQCMLDNNSFAATDLNDQLQATRQLLEGEGDIDSSRFLRVLQVLAGCVIVAEVTAVLFVFALSAAGGLLL